MVAETVQDRACRGRRPGNGRRQVPLRRMDPWRQAPCERRGDHPRGSAHSLQLHRLREGPAIQARLVLTPAADGTRIERTVDSPEPTGLLRVIYPLIWSLVIKPGMQ